MLGSPAAAVTPLGCRDRVLARRVLHPLSTLLQGLTTRQPPSCWTAGGSSWSSGESGCTPRRWGGGCCASIVAGAGEQGAVSQALRKPPAQQPWRRDHMWCRDQKVRAACPGRAQLPFAHKDVFPGAPVLPSLPRPNSTSRAFADPRS